MKLKILNAAKTTLGDKALPKQFEESYREELIRRAVHAVQASKRQPYGADPRAGKKSSAELSRRRRKYRGSYGQGISRVPRKILSRNGTRMYWVGAFAPGTVGGRRAHPPKASKEWTQELNDRERRKAIRSALGATVDAQRVKARGHKVPDIYPFILDDSVESIKKTRELKKALEKLGFKEELARCHETKVRAGKAKMRGRRTKRPTGLLLVTSTSESALYTAAGNLAGVTVKPVAELNAADLAPGTHAGRATLFTKSALDKLATDSLFVDAPKKRVSTKAEKEGAKKKVVKKRTAKTTLKAASAPSKKSVAKAPVKGEAA